MAWFIIAVAAVWVASAAFVVGATVLKVDWFVDRAHNGEGFFDMAGRLWRLSITIDLAPLIVVCYLISILLAGIGHHSGRKADKKTIF